MEPALIQLGIVDLPEDLSGQPNWLISVLEEQTSWCREAIRKNLRFVVMWLHPGEPEPEINEQWRALLDRLDTQHNRLLDELALRGQPKSLPGSDTELLQEFARRLRTTT